MFDMLGPEAARPLREDIIMQAGFEKLGLPAGFERRRLELDEAQLYVEFDRLHSFGEGNPETPKDHAPDYFPVELVEEGIEKGDVIEGIFDDQNELIATVWLSPNTPHEDVLEITNLVVRQDWRDRGRDELRDTEGIGHYFLTAAEAIAELHGATHCTLHVDPLNTRGMYLYMTKYGYQVVRYETSPELNMNDWLVMAKRIDGQLPLPLFEDLQSARTGDEARLEALLSSGYIGMLFWQDVRGGEPKKNRVVFAKPFVPEPDLQRI